MSGISCYLFRLSRPLAARPAPPRRKALWSSFSCSTRYSPLWNLREEACKWREGLADTRPSSRHSRGSISSWSLVCLTATTRRFSYPLKSSNEEQVQFQRGPSCCATAMPPNKASDFAPIKANAEILDSHVKHALARHSPDDRVIRPSGREATRHPTPFATSAVPWANCLDVVLPGRGEICPAQLVQPTHPRTLTGVQRRCPGRTSARK